jgi:hypothetical protein
VEPAVEEVPQQPVAERVAEQPMPLVAAVSAPLPRAVPAGNWRSPEALALLAAQPWEPPKFETVA